VKLVACLLLVVPAVLAGQHADVRIAGGLVHDGGGGPPREADVLLRDDRIVHVGDAAGWTAALTLDARGLLVTPGFIDPHVHAEGDLSSADRSRRQAGFAVMQGVTTVITGNDGRGPIGVSLALARLRQDSIGPNTAMLVGHGRIRDDVLGRADRPPTAAELDRMRALVDSAMRGGALGLSTGLWYAPGSWATTDEVVELAWVAGRYGGIYDSHIRDESSYGQGLLASIRETLEIGRRARLPVHIAHIKALGADVMGQSGAVIALIGDALRRGQRVSADQYPWTASSTGLASALLPRWAEVGGRDSLLTRLGDPAIRTRIAVEMRENLRRRNGPDALLLTVVSGSEAIRDEARGRTLAQFAAGRGIDPVDAAIAILREGGASVASFTMDEADIEAFMRQPFVVTGSDGSAGHPRKYASYPRKLRRYVLDREVIPMERMIAASSAQVAEVFGLHGRGRLCVGCFADVIVFDPAEVEEVATYIEPDRLARGMRWVFINGVAVVSDGSLTGALPGRALARWDR
jgi:N-acyl-D-aspartate/D-glutamate deacylase